MPVASNVCMEGGVIVGAVVSVMVTEEVAAAEFPAPSRALQVTVVVPSANEEGEWESASVVVETASVAVASTSVGVEVAAVASKV